LLVGEMASTKLEQRYAIKFCVKLKDNAAETFRKLTQAYGDHTMSRAQVFRWHKAFMDGREEVEDEARSGRPSTTRNDETVARVRDLVRTDRRLTVRMIADELNINRQAVYEILTQDLGMRKICAKMVPKNLTIEQKEHRMTVCRDLINRIETEPDIFKHVVTGDETWVFEYDPESKRQSAEWHTSSSPRQKKARKSKSRSC